MRVVITVIQLYVYAAATARKLKPFSVYVHRAFLCMSLIDRRRRFDRCWVYCVADLKTSVDITAFALLCLRQSRLAGGMMFSTWASVRPFVRPLPRYFENICNPFWYKLVQVVYAARGQGDERINF